MEISLQLRVREKKPLLGQIERDPLIMGVTLSLLMRMKEALRHHAESLHLPQKRGGAGETTLVALHCDQLMSEHGEHLSHVTLGDVTVRIQRLNHSPLNIWWGKERGKVRGRERESRESEGEGG